jgi:hypothetical protein
MVKMTPPMYANLAPDLVKSYSPPEEKINAWHTVKSGKTESLLTIAKQYEVPVQRLIEFNFPGSVKDGRVLPDIVNWYLYNHQRFRCRDTTRDGFNYMFRGGEKVAIPYLGNVEIGEPVFRSPTNTKFKLKMHANLNVSKIVGGDFSIFQIWDEKANLCSFYTYWAGGVSKSITPGFLSATGAGPWNDFAVTLPLAVNQFTGATRFTTGGGGSWTDNTINFMGLPPGTKTIPNPLKISTGFTIGIGGGTSVGTMNLELLGTPDGLLPFKGP